MKLWIMGKGVYQSPPVGQQISCVMKGIKKEILVRAENLKSTLEGILISEKFGILESVSHSFEPEGFTLMILLSESHLAIHTYPEHDSLYFNMYSCRGPNDSENTFNYLKENLKPEKIIFYKEEKIPVKD